MISFVLAFWAIFHLSYCCQKHLLHGRYQFHDHATNFLRFCMYDFFNTLQSVVLVADYIWLIGLFGSMGMNVILYSKKSSCMFLPFLPRFICIWENWKACSLVA